MRQTYEIECPHCQAKTTVEARHAGQQLTCLSCQKQFDVPKLRDLKLLEPETAPSQPAADARPNPLKAGLFALGLIFLILGTVAGWALFQFSGQLISPSGSEELAQAFAQSFDDSSPAEVWRFMEVVLQDRELPPYEQAEWRTQDQLGRLLRAASYGLMGLAALGLVMFVVSFAMLSQDQRRLHQI